MDSKAKTRLDSLLKAINPAYVAAPANELATVAGVQNGVAMILINNPPVNSFSPAVAEALGKAYDACLANDEVKAIVLTGAGKVFMAGADIPHLKRLIEQGNRSANIEFITTAHKLLNRMESGPKPVVAALNGDALGGGCELAMGCNARVALANAKLGLPELKLGVIPGLGGTQRLARLIGAKDAIAAILSSKPLAAPKAAKAGLVDVLVKKPEELIPAAAKLALAIAAGKVPRKISLTEKSKVPSKEEVAVVVGGARLQVKQKTPNLTHPLLALKALEAGLLNGPEAGIKAEVEAFADALEAPASKALIHFFLASKATTKIPGVDAKAAKPVKSVAILGGGTMGAGIAICFLMKNIPVILKEVNERFLAAGVERILSDIQTVVKARKMNPMVVEYLMRGLKPQLTYEGFDKVDLVIEAVIEDIPLKQKIFSELEQVCSPTCILATNTSTINVDLVSQKTKAQKRVIGLHFFSPAHIMPLLEIVKTDSTSAEVVATSVKLAQTIGKTPVVVGNCVGFVANRVFFPYGMAGSLLLQGGLSPYAVDKALMSFGMPMGIYRMNDSVGVDLGVHIAPIFTAGYPDRVYNTSLSARMVKAGRMGQKNGQGFYKYPAPRKAVPDAEALAPILKELAAEANGTVPATTKLSPQEIVEVCLYPVVNECARTLAEGFAASAADIDVVSVMGYGFPAYRGGLLHWGAQQKYATVVEKLNKYSEFFGAKNPALKSFFAPSQALIDLANKQKK
jgi:enoyl-CoA hydratase/3-hydroxyacyl-CoA dehydrogenase